ncbi:hypothetical protein BP00DRAFT_381902 [Aspergillus indologenus CBS 114.80]|uniref:Uncharacterized protein n=1 Tax=Aspergillus indologenus CBS 114.80 TaxID=1450541 RepID=A0A2V5HUR9_9EURO|nr:hypothetical protein BP00DRAFT_381902 [Aspergillus indologenus CBS 114.80]
MQESAQVVAWLMDNTSETRERLGIHISQDRHEIFLIFAQFDSDYIAYLENKLSDESALSFLTMHQYGPWNTESRSHMEELGPILLAITLYAQGQIQQRQAPKRR